MRVESIKYVESDTAWINRILGQEVGGKRNILVMNDEAHHAYRIRNDNEDGEEKKRTTKITSIKRPPYGWKDWTASTKCAASISASTCPPRRSSWDASVRMLTGPFPGL